MEGNWENAFLITRVRYKGCYLIYLTVPGVKNTTRYTGRSAKRGSTPPGKLRNERDRDAYRLDYCIVYVILLIPFC